MPFDGGSLWGHQKSSVIMGEASLEDACCLPIITDNMLELATGGAFSLVLLQTPPEKSYGYPEPDNAMHIPCCHILQCLAPENSGPNSML